MATRQRVFFFLFLLIAYIDARCLICDRLAARTEDTLSSSQGDDVKQVFVSYKNERGKLLVQQRANHSVSQGRAFMRLRTIEASVSVQSLLEMSQDEDIEFIEEVSSYRLFGEAATYTNRVAHADTIVEPNIAAAAAESSSESFYASCEDETSIKVAVVDSGMAIHPDLPCFVNNSQTFSCLGTEFGVEKDGKWYEPVDDHGTMVAGIIGALRNNNLGIAGIVDGRQICFLVVRVFDSVSSQASLSDVFDGIDWAVDKGARIINLSLGGNDESDTAKRFFEGLEKKGVLTIAAAGNAGTKEYSYPASYDSVVSVAALDENLERSFVSQFNDKVDLAAPGERVLSTTRAESSSRVVFIEVEREMTYDAGLVSGDMSEKITGTLVDCSSGKCQTTSSEEARLCFFSQSYSIQTAESICKKVKGTAVIIFNLQGFFPISVDTGEKQASIPVVGVTKETAGLIQENDIGSEVSLTLETAYGYAWGTSFAAPVVTGAAAALMVACPFCDVLSIRTCLVTSAEDIGADGRDDSFGYGLVQVDGAMTCLLENDCCSGNASLPSLSPTSASICSEEQVNYQGCFEQHLTFDEAESCVTCMNPSVPEDIESTSCQTIVSDVCNALNVCLCSPCQDAVEGYVQCLLDSFHEEEGCLLGCEDVTPSVPPSRSPSLSQDCKVEVENARACVEEDLLEGQAGDSCNECIDSLVNHDFALCSDVQTLVCSCPCGDCSSQLLSFAECSYRQKGLECAVDCDNESLVEPTSEAAKASSLWMITIISFLSFLVL